ncbi:MAG: SPFH domain-containing protein [Phycisphaerae bacterium]
MIKNKLSVIGGSVVLAAALVAGFVWFKCRIYVPEDRCAVLIRKTGDPLPPGQLVATEPGQKGIQEEVLGPGRYFRNPYTWDWTLKPLTEVPAGDPSTWEWIHSLSARQRDALRAGTFKFRGEFPQIGVVVRKVGKPPARGQVIVKRASGVKGILEEVLTPGTYKINPYVYEVELHPAAVIPAGFVGVVTNLFGDQPTVTQTSILSELADRPSRTGSGAEAAPEGSFESFVRPLAKRGERGTLEDVLQPGVYFINPKLQKVTLVQIGYNEYSQIRESDSANFRISFPSDTGYLIRVGVTVIWGVHPRHAAQTINEFGNIDGVLDKIIGPQLRSICRNIGSTYAARDFIQGEKREQFQRALTSELQRICRGKNIDILIALVREIEVHAPAALAGATEATEDLKRTIQQSYIAIENRRTKDKQREAAMVRATLEEERKKVDIARETIKADTRVMVANVLAEGEKQAAEIAAAAELEVATVQQQVALLDAQRTEILGKAGADVARREKEAEAEGYEMLVGALGSGEAYNLYTFAKNFQPDSIRLFFAGEGTFWTDLSRFEELGAAKLLQPETSAKPDKQKPLAARD